MGDYLDGQSNNGKGKHVKQVNVSQSIDIEALAAALAKKMPVITRFVGGGVGRGTDDFDDELSMQKLADAMIIKRKDNEFNFDNLGKIKEIKKDKKEVDATIDILKNLD